MRTGLLITAVVAASVNVSAQANKELTAWQYRVNGQPVYCVQSATPSGRLAFYSETQGGKMLREEQANSEGRLQLEAGKDFEPAFVLHRGTGKVLFLEQEEFSISEMETDGKNDVVLVSWTASADPAKNISFEILKSTDGKSYETITEIIAYSSGLSSPYSYTEEAGSAAHVYKIRVKNVKEGERYTSGPMAITGKKLRIYPTVTSSELNIDLLDDAGPAQYVITNNLGQSVLSGNLAPGKNVCTLASLSPGIYLITTTAPGLKTSVKLVKE